MDEHRLLELYFSRDEAAISETRNRFGAYCFKIANNILGNREDCEECVSDTYLKAWNSIPPERPSSFKAYLGRITRNLSFNKLKGRKAKHRGSGQLEAALEELEECLSDGNTIEQISDNLELERAINDFLSILGSREREIFLRRYWYVEAVADISSTMRLSEGAIKQSLFRTRGKMRAFLEKEKIYI